MIANNKNKRLSIMDALKQLFSCLAPYKILIAIALFSGLISAVASLMTPLTIKQISALIIIAIRPGGVWDFNAILMWGWITLGLLLAAFVFQFMQSHIVYGVIANVCYSLRQKLVQKINLLPISYFDQRDHGEILSYITNDTDELSLSFGQILFNSLHAIIVLFGSIVILFVFSYVIGLVVLMSLPLILLVIMLISKKTIKYFSKRQKMIAEITTRSEENYEAQAIINAFNATSYYQNKFDTVNESLRKTWFVTEIFNGIFSPILNFFSKILFSLICLTAGYLIGSLGGSPDDVATIVAAISYGTQLITPLLIFAEIFANGGRIVATSNRIFSFLGEKEEPNENSKTLKLKNVTGNINFNNVSFGYSKKNVINNFTQRINAGQKIAIVGHTGAGKTTLINLIMRFYEVNKGSIEIEGVDTRKMNRKYVRSLFGMVLQDTWTFEGTFKENIKFANKNISDKTIYRVCKEAHCDEFIKQMGGYNKKINEKSGLSYGQMQLLCIARAMALDAPLLILDEATSNVDVHTEMLVQSALDKLMKGKTSFVIAHRLSTIKNADLILVMKNGRIVESGKHDELLAKNGVYAELYYSQFCFYY